MGRLAGKVCVITGTGGSMGRAASLLFAREGASIVGCDVQEQTSRQTTEAVREAGGSMVSLEPCDISTQAGAERLMDLAIREFGRIDVLYNNAGNGFFEWFPEMTHQQFRDTLVQEVDSVFLCSRAAWPHLVASGSGAIVNVASVSGMICYEVLPGLAHSTAKAGVLGLTRHLAMEGGPHGVRANAISPGLVLTNATRDFLNVPGVRDAMMRKLMLQRVGAPEEVVPAALFLASDEARWITGANLPVDGGTTAW